MLGSVLLFTDLIDKKQLFLTSFRTDILGKRMVFNLKSS